MNEPKYATFKIAQLDSQCGEPGCTKIPTRVAIAVFWHAREIGVNAFCEQHARDAMARARAEKSTEENLQ